MTDFAFSSASRVGGGVSATLLRFLASDCTAGEGTSAGAGTGPGAWLLSSATICGAAGLTPATRVPCHTATTAIATTPAVESPTTRGRCSHCQKPPSRLAGVSNEAQQRRPGRRIGQEIAQRLIVGQRVEQLLIFQGGGKQRLLLCLGQRAGGVSAQ